jgi:NTE family protein
MKRAFESMHRKAHDSIIKRLHDHAAAGRLDGFVLSYLGQQDNSLPLIPPDLIRRDEVVGYPTDFRAMSARDIELIAGRGEQLTRLLVARYIPEI